MYGLSLGSAFFGAVLLQSLNAGANGVETAPVNLPGFAMTLQYTGMVLAPPHGPWLNWPSAFGSQLAWDTVKRFNSGTPPPANATPPASGPSAGAAAPAEASPAASDTVPAASAPSGTPASPPPIPPSQGEAATGPDSGTGTSKTVEAAPSPDASGQAAAPEPQAYKAPSVETTPAGVTIYRGP
jgi:hypothetical protein